MLKKEYPTVQNILADCQEAAIQIGEFIEKLEGVGTQAVSYLSNIVKYYIGSLYN